MKKKSTPKAKPKAKGKAKTPAKGKAKGKTSAKGKAKAKPKKRAREADSDDSDSDDEAPLVSCLLLATGCTAKFVNLATKVKTSRRGGVKVLHTRVGRPAMCKPCGRCAILCETRAE